MSANRHARLSHLVGAEIDELQPLSGGCVGDVNRAELSDGRTVVIKSAPEGTDEAQGIHVEGDMLIYLRTHSHLPVPDVLARTDGALVMEYLNTGGGLSARVQDDAAHHVAKLHDISTDDGFGFDFDTVIGGLHQPNPWTPSWVDFFRDQRLMSMGRDAERVGRMPTLLLNRLSQFCENLDRWILEPPSPSLLHGDMWSGNVLSAQHRITGFIDPAIYFGHAEIELAFTTLFSTFGRPFFDEYQKLRAIEPGFFEERLDIYNLYPLLVHVRLFGGSYVGSVERTLRKFGF
ncbi:fructosamine kinase family protein [Magnetovibrio sp. PR-2]|uniref:fructosamine kinase family protein n=1 Tax=Magnetovibrio sp. PR-2 TaxID=3120356 RepID=UPI002FCE2167